MRNPFEVLFGTEMVARLRKRPSALKRIASQSKAQLMAALHPDQNHEIGPEQAAEVSEAYEHLSKADKNEFEELLKEFLDNQGGRRRVEELKHELRDLKRKKGSGANNLSAELVKQKEENVRMSAQLREAQREREEAFRHAWSWIHTGVRIRNAHRKPDDQSISRGHAHQFRIVAKANVNGEDKYKAFEFDITGHIRRVITADKLNHAGNAYLYKGGPTFLDTDIKHGSGVLVGSIPRGKRIQSKTVYESLLNGEVSPYLWIGQVLVTITHLDTSFSQTSLAFEEQGMIVDMIDIRASRRARAKGRGPGGRLAPMNAKILKFKRERTRKGTSVKKEK